MKSDELCKVEEDENGRKLAEEGEYVPSYSDGYGNYYCDSAYNKCVVNKRQNNDGNDDQQDDGDEEEADVDWNEIYEVKYICQGDDGDGSCQFMCVKECEYDELCGTYCTKSLCEDYGSYIEALGDEMVPSVLTGSIAQ